MRSERAIGCCEIRYPAVGNLELKNPPNKKRVARSENHCCQSSFTTVTHRNKEMHLLRSELFANGARILECHKVSF